MRLAVCLLLTIATPCWGGGRGVVHLTSRNRRQAVQYSGLKHGTQLDLRCTVRQPNSNSNSEDETDPTSPQLLEQAVDKIQNLLTHSKLILEKSDATCSQIETQMVSLINSSVQTLRTNEELSISLDLVTQTLDQLLNLTENSRLFQKDVDSSTLRELSSTIETMSVTLKQVAIDTQTVGTTMAALETGIEAARNAQNEHVERNVMEKLNGVTLWMLELSGTLKILVGNQGKMETRLAQTESLVKEALQRPLETESILQARLKHFSESLMEELRDVVKPDPLSGLSAETVRTFLAERDSSSFWPEGSYGLMATQDGCPEDDELSVWHSGSRKHHTETDNNANSVSTPNHFRRPVMTTEGGNHFLTQHFCVREKLPGRVWPKGSYCVNRVGRCPPGFEQGMVRWDEEDTDRRSTTSGVLPDGDYDDIIPGSTSLYYCCRADSAATSAIVLPTSRSFYLYRHGGQCQEVDQMKVTQEIMVFDTEDKDNDDKLSGTAPDASVPNVNLKLCYYQPE